MWSALRQSLIRGPSVTSSVINKTKRYAGHSKWANIKHDKAVEDSKRASMFGKLIRQMNVAITEEGSYKPADNTKLAQIIEQAKKKNMPMATIKGVLDKAAKSTTKSQIATIDVRGPGGCLLTIVLHTDNLKGTKMFMQSVFKKFRATVIDQSARNVFHHKGFIITEPKNDLNEATEDAIAVGAEDVEEIEEDGKKRLQFTCEPMMLPKVAHLLAGRKYEIVLREERYTPHTFANLSDDELERATALYTKIQAFEEVVIIYDNIA